jgi:hypothetical protein
MQKHRPTRPVLFLGLHLSIVMVGLDPTIHATGARMDPRVEPEDDGGCGEVIGKSQYRRPKPVLSLLILDESIFL